MNLSAFASTVVILTAAGIASAQPPAPAQTPGAGRQPALGELWNTTRKVEVGPWAGLAK